MKRLYPLYIFFLFTSTSSKTFAHHLTTRDCLGKNIPLKVAVGQVLAVGNVAPNKAKPNDYEREISASASEVIRASLYLKNNDSSIILADGVLAEFNNNYSREVTIEDGVKMTNINENFALRRDGHLLSIERRPLVGRSDTLFFDLTHTTSRNYSLKFEASNFPSSVSAVLEDAYLQTTTKLNLTAATVVNFGVVANTASADASRFRIVFKTAPIYYRSASSGNWNNASIWEASTDSSNWLPATQPPDSSSTTITIQSGDSVSITANVTVGHTSVQPTAALSVNNGIALKFVDNGLVLEPNKGGAARTANSASGKTSASVIIESDTPARRSQR